MKYLGFLAEDCEKLQVSQENVKEKISPKKRRWISDFFIDRRMREVGGFHRPPAHESIRTSQNDHGFVNASSWMPGAVRDPSSRSGQASFHSRCERDFARTSSVSSPFIYSVFSCRLATADLSRLTSYVSQSSSCPCHPLFTTPVSPWPFFPSFISLSSPHGFFAFFTFYLLSALHRSAITDH